MRLSLLFIFLIISFLCYAQEQDTTYLRKKISSTEITKLLSFYTQDGNHSAVTGGTGTENLQVYSIKLGVKHNFNPYNKLIFGFDVDVITSASTDRIDFQMSSASIHDGHEVLTIGYEKRLKKKPITIGLLSKFALESDYFSRGVVLSGAYTTPNQMTRVALNLQAYFDDLRWGRLNGPGFKPIRLIYPEELRGVEWFDIHNRNSYNVNLTIQQDLNKKMTLGVFPSIVLQKGLLSTPFHRVFFADDPNVRVENLPRQNVQTALGIQLNTFTFPKMILRSYYQVYRDDFGITAHTFKLETPYKVKPNFSLSPSVRFYTQTASDFFQPYREHQSEAEFYTSDYDLSGFWSLTSGLSSRFLLRKPIGKRAWLFDRLSLRYSYYYRSDGLQAHIISTFLV